jgi:hypothetical protein
VDLLVDVTTGSPSAARPTPVDFATTYRDYLRAHCEQISAPVGP